MASDEDEDLQFAIALSLQVDAAPVSQDRNITSHAVESLNKRKRKDIIDVDAFEEASSSPHQLTFAEQRKLDEAARLERMKKRGINHRSQEPSERPMKKQRTEEMRKVPTPAVSALLAIRRTKANRPSEMQFTKGAIRLTRTPGRQTEPYCISLDDLIDSRTLKTAFVHSFFVAQDELFRYFPFAPFGNPRSECTVYIGRDLFMDDYGLGAAGLTRESKAEAGKMSDYEWAKACSKAAKYYKNQYGENFKAVYTRMTGGCAHSKVLILVYERFLRVVITSANMMEGDTAHSDNHWYIHDFPKLDTKCVKRTAFEKQLFAHLADLACPVQFLEDLRGQYDFASTNDQVRLVVSKPGSHKGPDALKYGSLRLRTVVGEILGDRNDQMNFEVCAGSVGKLESVGRNGNPGFLQGFLESCSGGTQALDPNAPPLKLVYPTKQTVSNSTMGELAASNIGSHVQWDTAPSHIKRLYHDYRSKDPGMLFHQKIIIGRFNDARPSDPPAYIYIGSANISAAAWGLVALDKKDRKKEGALRLADGRNYECGVVVRGEDLVALLGGESTWDSIIPYHSSLKPYGPGERPWNSSAWVS